MLCIIEPMREQDIREVDTSIVTAVEMCKPVLGEILDPLGTSAVVQLRVFWSGRVGVRRVIVLVMIVLAAHGRCRRQRRREWQTR